jgi:hypothetical protein
MFTSCPNFAGNFPIIFYVVTDGIGSSVKSSRTINVTAVDDSFTDASEAITVLEDSGTTSGNLLAGTSSPDGSVSIQSFSIAGQSGSFTIGTAYTIPTQGSLTIHSKGSFSFTPAANFNGSFLWEISMAIVFKTLLSVPLVGAMRRIGTPAPAESILCMGNLLVLPGRLQPLLA